MQAVGVGRAGQERADGLAGDQPDGDRQAPQRLSRLGIPDAASTAPAYLAPLDAGTASQLLSRRGQRLPSLVRWPGWSRVRLRLRRTGTRGVTTWRPPPSAAGPRRAQPVRLCLHSRPTRPYRHTRSCGPSPSGSELHRLVPRRRPGPRSPTVQPDPSVLASRTPVTSLSLQYTPGNAGSLQTT